jgi:hypothetical protein
LPEEISQGQNMPGLQAGNDSFAIEKTITAHDELFKDDVLP